MAKDYKHGHLLNGSIVYAENPALIGGAAVFNPTDAQYLTCNPPEKRVDLAQPTDPAPTGYHYEADGYDETETTITRHWNTVEDAKVYRTFSKLKLYGAIAQLGAWDKVKEWLESKEINGINGWMAFTLAQDVSEDNALFAVMADEARQLLGLDEATFNTLLDNCKLEG